VGTTHRINNIQPLRCLALNKLSSYEVLGIFSRRTGPLPFLGKLLCLSPNYIVQDGVIPRTALPRVMSEIERLSQEAGVRVANVFHAGDGNLHPLVLYDRRIPGQEEAAEALSSQILELCIAAGGSITGEHGVGEDKKKMMAKMFAEPDLATMQRVRCAFDPLQLSNPTKVFPTPRLCGEKPGEYVPHPSESAGIAERY